LFGGSFEKVEGLGGFGGDRILGFLEVVGDFEDAGGVGGEGSDLFRCVGPVDGGGSRPEVVVFGAVVVVKVELGDAGFEELEGFVDADVFFRLGEMSVAYVEAYADAVEVADAKDFEDVLGSGDVVLEVFDKDAGTKGVGEGLEVLDGGEGVFKSARVPGVAFLTEVEDTGFDWDLLG